MEEFWILFKRLDLKGLFLQPTTNGFLQFFRYAFVGGFASLVDWGLLFLFETLGLHYLAAAVVGFVGGLVTNFLLSKKLVFQAEEARVQVGGEFIGYAVIGLIGLGITMMLMYLLTDLCHLYFMLSKIIATFIVLVWNYLARKILLYRR